MSQDSSKPAGKLPGTYKRFAARYPELAQTHEKIAQSINALGHLDERTTELVKIGICVGAGLESALRAHVRRATQAGATQAEIEQAILQGMNTCGFPRTVAAWSWAQQQFERDEAEQVEAERPSSERQQQS